MIDYRYDVAPQDEKKNSKSLLGWCVGL